MKLKEDTHNRLPVVAGTADPLAALVFLGEAAVEHTTLTRDRHSLGSSAYYSRQGEQTVTRTTGVHTWLTHIWDVEAGG